MQNIKQLSVFLDTSIQDALKIFGTYDGVRLLVVNDRNGKFLGILTDPDIRRGLLKGLSLSSPVESIVQKSPITASIKDSKQKLIELSVRHNIYEIPLLDENGKIVRIESIASLLKTPTFDNPIVIMAGGLGKRLLSQSQCLKSAQSRFYKSF